MGVGRWDSFITTSLQLLPNVQVSLLSQIPSVLAYLFRVFFFIKKKKVVDGESMFYSFVAQFWVRDQQHKLRSDIAHRNS